MYNFEGDIPKAFNPETISPELGLGETPTPETDPTIETPQQEFVFTPEQMLEMLREMPLLQFAEMFAPHLLDILLEIMLKLGLPLSYLEEIKIDFDLPANVMGAFVFEKLERTSDLDPGYVKLNPLFLLSANEIDIASVITHEGLHAGWFTEGVRVHDEGMTELMTEEKMKLAYGVTGTKTAYDNWVAEIRVQVGDVSFHELTLLVKQKPEEMLQRLCNLLTVGSIFADPDEDTLLNFEEIDGRLQRALEILSRLFPRLIDLNNHAEFEDNTRLIFSEQMRENTYRYAAYRLVNDPVKMQQTMQSALNSAANPSPVEVFNQLRIMGFQYLIDFYPNEVLERLMTN